MTNKTLDSQLKKADWQQDEKDFVGLNETLIELMNDDDLFRYLDFELETRRTSDWDDDQAVLIIKCGQFLFKLPIPI